MVDGRGYCSAVRDSFDTLRVELGQATSAGPADVSDETALLAAGAGQSATTNIGLLDRCIADDVPFLTGLVEKNGYLGRPADVMVMKDGSLLVSDDHNGAIYRIRYGK